VEAVGANGTRASNNTDVPITKNDDWITGCVGLCEADDEIMDLGLAGMIGMGSPLLPQWNALKAEIRTEARTKCNDRVTELSATLGVIHFNGMIDVSCETATSLFDPYQGSRAYSDFECQSAETGTEGGTGGTGADESGGMDVGPGIYGLTSYSQVRSCTTNTAARTISCNVDQEFIADVANEVATIFSDSAYLVPATGPNGVRGYKFQTSPSDSLLYSLGFRTNDLLFSIDNFPVTNFVQGTSLFGHLGQTSYTGTKAVAKFYRGTQQWTLTVNRKDFSSYP
jgi:hypothetical protein